MFQDSIKYGNLIHSLKLKFKLYAAFNMQNMSGGVNQECAAVYAKTNEVWKCIFSQVSLLDAKQYAST